MYNRTESVCSQGRSPPTPRTYTLAGELRPLLMLNQHPRKSQRMPGVQSEGCPPSFSCVGEGFGVPSPASKDDGMIQPTDAVVLSAKGVGDIPWHVWSPLARSAHCEIQRGKMVAAALV